MKSQSEFDDQLDRDVCTEYLEQYLTEKKEMKTVYEKRDVTMFSVAFAGDALYYTAYVEEGEVSRQGMSYTYGTVSLNKVELSTGKETELYQERGSEERFNSCIEFVMSDYAAGDKLVYAVSFCSADRSTQNVEGKTEFYYLDVKKNKCKSYDGISVPELYTQAYLSNGSIWYWACGFEQKETIDLKAINCETKEVSTELTVSNGGYVYNDYAVFWTNGDNAHNYLYRYDTHELLSSRLTKPQSARIIGMGVQQDLLALDATDYDSMEGIQMQDMGTYEIAESEKYISENYQPYAGEDQTIIWKGSDPADKADEAWTTQETKETGGTFMPDDMETCKIKGNAIVYEDPKEGETTIYQAEEGETLEQLYFYQNDMYKSSKYEKEDGEEDAIMLWSKDEARFIPVIMEDIISDIAFYDGHLLCIYCRSTEASQDAEETQYAFMSIDIKTLDGYGTGWRYADDRTHDHSEMKFDQQEYGKDEDILITETYRSDKGEQKLHYRYDPAAKQIEPEN